MRRVRFVVSLTIVATSVVAAADFPRFEHKVIDPHAGDIVYAVTHADVDGDGKQDVVAVTENAVSWYAAPDWAKHTIIKDQTVRDNVCIAAHDVDADGQVDFALGAGWPNSGGTIQWLSRKESLDEPWDVHFIGKIPSTHRMRWADVLGTKTPQLVVSPLNKSGDDPGVRLTAFEIPADPETDRWNETVLDNSLNRMHNHSHLVSPDGYVITFTASQEGVHAVLQVPNPTRAFAKVKIADGATGDKPTAQGAGEIRNSADRQRIATIEPMHGNMVVIYVGEPGGSPSDMKWTRHVLDDTLGRGHALAIADLDADGDDEVIAGHSDPATGEIKGPGVYAYLADDDSGSKWTKHVIDDGGMATEDLFVLDLTGDGRPDILAGGRNTHNVKLYINTP